MNVLVLDVGTSGMRGTLLDQEAAVLLQEQVKYCPAYGENGCVEQSPEDWTNALEHLCSVAAAKGHVDAIALTAQRSSVIPVDGNGMPLCSAIMWQDTRNKDICAAREAQRELVLSRCGTGINTVFSGGKLTWLRYNEPELYEKTHCFFVVPDHLIFHMTGERVTDHTYGSRSMLMDLHKRVWAPELLELFEVEEEKLCRLIPPSSVAGYITETFAQRTGLPPAIPVISCGGDQQCAALGQGVLAPGAVSANLGTGGYLIAAIDRAPDSFGQGLLCNASAIPEQYILESSVLTCGAALDWFQKEFCPNDGPELVATALRDSPPGANGVCVLPYFQGRSNPEWDSDVRASFHGISLATTKADLLRGLLEGICCEISRHIGLIEGWQQVDVLHVSGGVVQTDEMIQLLANVCGKAVICTGTGDATTRGAWMSAVHCLGLVPTWLETWKMVRPREERIAQPQLEWSAYYRDKLAHMETLYHRHTTDT